MVFFLQKLQMAAKHTRSWGPSEHQYRYDWLEHKVERWQSERRSTTKGSADILDEEQSSVSENGLANTITSNNEVNNEKNSGKTPTPWEMY